MGDSPGKPPRRLHLLGLPELLLDIFSPIDLLAKALFGLSALIGLFSCLLERLSHRLWSPGNVDTRKNHKDERHHRIGHHGSGRRNGEHTRALERVHHG
jgi:hypothetical protein